MTEPKLVQAWDLTEAGRRHRVEVRGSVRRRVAWTVDGALVGRQVSAEDRIVVAAGAGVGEEPDDGPDDGPALGSVGVLFTALGSPRRATLYGADEKADVKALAGVGGTDLVPEEGSRAARHEARVRAHPGRYTAIQVAGGVAKVVVPILVALLAVRFAVRIPWPDLDLPLPDLPDLPSLPLPDLPSIPWPDWSLPGWLTGALDYVKYVWPIALAFVLARVELRRRRTQDERRRAAQKAERSTED